MCRKGASADVQSLDKHVEGMIHLKRPRPGKTEESFLTFRMGARREEMDQWSRLALFVSGTSPVGRLI